MELLDRPILVKTFQGLEQVLAKEMADLGADNITEHTRAVECSNVGSTDLIYRLNLHLRSAIRIYLKLLSDRAHNYDELYSRIKELPWDKLIRPTQTLAVDATCYSDIFTHSHFTALKVKDAITDRIRESIGRRPNVDVKAPTYGIHILIRGLDFELYLDTSGSPLFKRGYRADGAKAPINEVLAAGLILLSDWPNSGMPLWDPMCGSGTIPIEAAMIQGNVAPGMLREDYGFMRWPDYDPGEWQGLLKNAEGQLAEKPMEPIFASDISGGAIRTARSNALASGMRDRIRFFVKDFLKAEPPADQGVIITNPPYDKRIPVEDSVSFYQAIGDHLKAQLQGWQAWIFSGQLEGMKHFGLRPSRKYQLMNGAIPCRFNKYELFSGRRKEFLASNDQD